MAPPGVAWSTKLESNYAKAMAVWFNSTLNLLQLLLNRKETRGAFMQFDEYMLEEALVLDVASLKSSDREYLVDAFNQVKDQEFPSILQQLTDGFPQRFEVDKAVMKVLGFNEQEIKSVLPKLYEALADEIGLLKEIMAERPPETETA